METTEMLEARKDLWNFLPMLKLFKAALGLQSGKEAELQMAIIAKRPDGTGQIGPTWDAEEFMQTLEILAGPEPDWDEE